MSLRLASVCLTLSVALGCASEPMVEMVPTESSNLPTCDPDNGGLSLPEGFCAVVFADDLGRPRHIDVPRIGSIPAAHLRDTIIVCNIHVAGQNGVRRVHVIDDRVIAGAVDRPEFGKSI